MLFWFDYLAVVSLLVGKRFTGTKQTALEQNSNSAIAATEGHSESHAWGEFHLWFRDRKDPELSGFVEPRIPLAFSRGSVNSQGMRSGDVGDLR